MKCLLIILFGIGSIFYILGAVMLMLMLLNSNSTPKDRIIHNQFPPISTYRNSEEPNINHEPGGAGGQDWGSAGYEWRLPNGNIQDSSGNIYEQVSPGVVRLIN